VHGKMMLRWTIQTLGTRVRTKCGVPECGPVADSFDTLMNLRSLKYWAMNHLLPQMVKRKSMGIKDVTGLLLRQLTLRGNSHTLKVV
jgi:hypothetical protein